MARMDSLDDLLRDWNRDHEKILEGLNQLSKASRAVDPPLCVSLVGVQRPGPIRYVVLPINICSCFRKGPDN